MPILEPNSLAVVANKLAAQFYQSVRSHFVGDHRNFIQFEVVVGGGGSGQKRG